MNVLRARQGMYLTTDQLRASIPSAFATEPHESRSSKYVYIPTGAIIEKMASEGLVPVFATQSRTRIEGKEAFTKHLIRFRHIDQVGQLAVVGETVYETCLLNSHDGTSSYDLSAGVHRFVCSNGMMVSTGIVDSIRVPHKGNIIDNVIEGTYRIIDSQDNVTQSIEGMRQTQLTLREQILLSETALSLKYGMDDDGDVSEKSPITPERALTVRRSADQGDSLWQTFSRIQENLIKGGIRGTTSNGRRTTTREVTGVDQLVKLNRALWALAEKMKELKGA